MTTLTLIYTADSAGNFTDPATGKRWDMPENDKFFRDTIAGRSIICGRKAAEECGENFTMAEHCTVLTTDHDFFQSEEALPIFEAFKKSRPPVEQATRRAVAMGRLYVDGVISDENKRTAISCDLIQADDVLEALQMAKHNKAGRFTEIFCVGGKQTIEAFAPFASRILLTYIGNGFAYIPAAISAEIGILPIDNSEEDKLSPYQKATLWGKMCGANSSSVAGMFPFINFFSRWCGGPEGKWARLDLRRNLPIEF